MNELSKIVEKFQIYRNSSSRNVLDHAELFIGGERGVSLATNIFINLMDRLLQKIGFHLELID